MVHNRKTPFDLLRQFFSNINYASLQRKTVAKRKPAAIVFVKKLLSSEAPLVAPYECEYFRKYLYENIVSSRSSKVTITGKITNANTVPRNALIPIQDCPLSATGMLDNYFLIKFIII